MGAVSLEAGEEEGHERREWPGRDVRGATLAGTAAPSRLDVRQPRHLPDWVWFAGVVGCGLVALGIAATLTIRVPPADASGAFAGTKRARPRDSGALARWEFTPPR